MEGEARSCTCHPDDAPVPCQRGYALSVCKARAALRDRAIERHRLNPGTELLDAAIDVALEEAAKVCDDYPKRDPAEDGNGYWAAEECAAAIRALITPGKEEREG
jgi:hypothetical protein